MVLNFGGESELETVRGRGIVDRRFKEGICISYDLSGQIIIWRLAE